MKKGERTKVLVIEKAIDLSFKEGWGQVNFNKLAKLCNLSQSAFYKYFKNKTDLMLHCQLHCAGNGRDFIDKYINNDEAADIRLTSYIRGNLMWAKEHPSHVQMISSMYYFSNNNPSIHEVFKTITETGLGRVRSILLAGVREKIWQIDDLELLVDLIHSYLVGKIIKASNDKDYFKDLNSSLLFISKLIKEH